MFLGHSFGFSEAEQQLSEAGVISSRISNVIIDLDHYGSTIVPALLDECMGELRSLFDQEEVLMIRSVYPDYTTQQLAHKCFLNRMRVRCDQWQEDDCDPGREAADWLVEHETQSGFFFRMYLKRRAGNREHPFAEFSPDRVLLHPRRIGRDD